jgi:hypothetical protein
MDPAPARSVIRINGHLGDAGQVTAPRGQRQLQRRDRHPEAVLAIG